MSRTSSLRFTGRNNSIATSFQVTDIQIFFPVRQGPISGFAVLRMTAARAGLSCYHTA